MTIPSTQQGTCLCGAVTLRVEVTEPSISVCHCHLCRIWSGGPMLAVESARPTLTGEENVGVYATSDWAERGFCRRCGTHLFYRLKSGEHYAIPAGLLGDAAPWTLALQIFTDDKPDYYDFANPMRSMTGAEVFEAFGKRDEPSSDA